MIPVTTTETAVTVSELITGRVIVPPSSVKVVLRPYKNVTVVG
jgi:hypothetical protein